MAQSYSLLDQPFVFVDIDTTGGSYRYSRVLEVGVVRVENGQVVREFSKLINSGNPVPAFITKLTGITNEDIVGAPSFADIAHELSDILDGAIFVAHNVHFDHNFLKMEFDRLGAPFKPSLLCTVRLSRALFPTVKGHKLQDIITRFDIPTQARHRAYDDALVLWQFTRIVYGIFDLDTIEEATKKQLKSPSVPSHLDKSLIENLPETAGVYVFEDQDSTPLYVGKSVNIKKRVMSHFSDYHGSSTELKISTQIRNIRTVRTHGELGALLTESRMIKDLQPMYNKRLRRKARVTLALRYRDKDGYSRVMLKDADEITPDDAQNILSTFSSSGRAKLSLDATCRNFYLCPKLLNLEKAHGECFMSQLKKCFGACTGSEDVTRYNDRFEAAFEHTQVTEWEYGSPILITEKDSTQDGSDGFVVNQWCLVQSLKDDGSGEVSTTPEPYQFDLDMYKILKSYIPKHRRNIKLITQPV
jgi:DNA polymerase-3 subunit epsilon